MGQDLFFPVVTSRPREMHSRFRLLALPRRNGC
jgi:hypothetical protein